MSAITPTFAGEMQLAGWSESHTSGCKVTFWLQSPDDLEAFRALTVRKGNTAGHRFMAALVEIGDDELPVQNVSKDGAKIDTSPERVQKTAESVHDKPKGGPLAIEAAALCRNAEYQRLHGFRSEREAADDMKQALMIESRAAIDHDEIVKAEFISRFRAPFMKYMQARGG